MYDSIYIYVPAMKQILHISEGSGDNLTDDDMEHGYLDYIYYDTYAMDGGIRETDGGLVLLSNLFREMFTCTKDAVPYVLDMAYSNDLLEYIVLN